MPNDESEAGNCSLKMSCGEVNTLSLIFYASLSKDIHPSSQDERLQWSYKKTGKGNNSLLHQLCQSSWVYGSLFSEGGIKTWREIAWEKKFELVNNIGTSPLGFSVKQ